MYVTPDEITTLAVAVGRLEQKMDDHNGKLDAIHNSLKEDIGRVEGQARKTNGKVAEQSGQISRLQGAVGMLAFLLTVGTPVAIFLAPHFH